jgi:putative transposase
LGLKKSDRKDLALGIYENNNNTYPKCKIAETLQISESTLYYINKLDSKDLELKLKILNQYEIDDTLGAKKLSPLIKSSIGRISRIMLKYDILPRKKKKKYTYAGRSNDLVNNRLMEIKNIEDYEVIFSDIFEFKLSRGEIVYGCFMMRKKTRQILSFSYSRNMKAELVRHSIKHIYLSKDLKETDILFHSDQGSQYGADIIVNQLLEYQFERSMNRAGTPTDNGYAERFVGTFKHSVVERYKYERIEEFAEFTYKWLNFYNNTRPHESLGQKSPNEFARENNLSVVRVLIPNLL